MKLKVVPSNRFKRDLKRIAHRGYNVNRLNQVVNMLAERKVLPVSNCDHPLSGKWTGYRECHIQPDWLLIYKYVEKELLLILMRTGTHADLLDM